MSSSTTLHDAPLTRRCESITALSARGIGCCRDARRVLAKPYLPGEEALLPGESRAHLLMARVLAIPGSRT